MSRPGRLVTSIDIAAPVNQAVLELLRKFPSNNEMQTVLPDVGFSNACAILKTIGITTPPRRTLSADCHPYPPVVVGIYLGKELSEHFFRDHNATFSGQRYADFFRKVVHAILPEGGWGPRVTSDHAKSPLPPCGSIA